MSMMIQSEFATIKITKVNRLENVYEWQSLFNVIRVEKSEVKDFELHRPMLPWELSKVFYDDQFVYYRRIGMNHL